MAQDATPSPALADYEPTLADDRDGILAGLRARPKHISPKYFYDGRGSELFDRICELPEYYPTRTELTIMRQHGAEIADAVGAQACLIEFGSGSSVKIRALLATLRDVAAYVPVEISRSHLLASTEALARDFPALEIRPVCADFTQPFDLPVTVNPVRRRVAWFPGSTIGNFEHADAVALLRVMRTQIGDDGALLIGVDLDKDPDILERAYNDAAGVTAEFNLNLLRRLNRELGADFDLSAFAHRAHYDTGRQRIEMRLYSRHAQRVTVGGETIAFEEDEYIVTEYSHKYPPDAFAAMASHAGFTVSRLWTDPDRLFSVQFLEAGVRGDQSGT